MAIYDNLNISQGMKTYLRLTSVGLGLMGYAINEAQKLGQNQVWGMDADTVKHTLLGIGASALVSTFMLATKTRDRLDERRATLSIDDRLEHDSGLDNEDDIAA